MNDLDLFGKPVPPLPAINMATGKPKRNDMARGYAARPGSGPEGQTCGTCEHCARTAGGNGRFYKCAIIRHRWTGGPGTDIRLKSPACLHWSLAIPPEPPAGYRWVKLGESFAVGDRWLRAGQLGDPMEAGDTLVGNRMEKDCVYSVARPLAEKP